jgi:hypothetical protein
MRSCSPDPENPAVMSRISASPSILVLMWLLTGVGRAAPPPPEPGGYFAIEVVDDQTGRGVPMVELQTTNGKIGTEWNVEPPVKPGTDGRYSTAMQGAAERKLWLM